MKQMETNRKLIKTLGKTEKLIKLKGRGPELPPPSASRTPFNFISFSVFPWVLISFRLVSISFISFPEVLAIKIPKTNQNLRKNWKTNKN